MNSEIIFEVEESPEGGYDARALGHSIYTQAETIDELKTMLQDAVRCHFDENDRPRVIRLHLVKDEVRLSYFACVLATNSTRSSRAWDQKRLRPACCACSKL